MDYAVDARGSGVAAGSSQLTVSLWARIPPGTTAPAGGGESLISHVSFTLSAESMNVSVHWTSGMPRFQLYLYWDGGFDRADTTTTTNLSLGEWHHVAFAVRAPGSTATDFTREIYVDGVREGLTGTCCGYGDLRSTFFWTFFPSRIERDDVRIYSRELTDTEIAGIYAAENVPEP